MSALDIKTASQHVLAAAAYTSVADIATVEMNDRNRLGFHIYMYLIGEIASVHEAVLESRSRLKVSSAEASQTILAALRAQGIDAK